jgi:hypothetical protein
MSLVSENVGNGIYTTTPIDFGKGVCIPDKPRGCSNQVMPFSYGKDPAKLQGICRNNLPDGFLDVLGEEPPDGVSFGVIVDTPYMDYICPNGQLTKQRCAINYVDVNGFNFLDELPRILPCLEFCAGLPVPDVPQRCQRSVVTINNLLAAGNPVTMQAAPWCEAFGEDDGGQYGDAEVILGCENQPTQERKERCENTIAPTVDWFLKNSAPGLARPGGTGTIATRCSANWFNPGARKDPHIRFAHGGRADIRGEDGAIFNFLSAKNISLNIGFEAADFRWSKRLVHGTRIDAAYWNVLASNGKTVTVAYAADKNATTLRHATVTVSGTDAPIRVTSRAPFSMADVRVSLKERALTVVGARWSAIASTSAFPFAALNKDKVLLDLEVKPLYDADADPVAPHGLWGQSYDGDGIALDGKLDAPKGPEMTTTAQAEGAIEGTVLDYKVAGPFATDFKYARYNATSAKHRDVTKLTGAKTHKHHDAVAPGALGGAGFDGTDGSNVEEA